MDKKKYFFNKKEFTIGLLIYFLPFLINGNFFNNLLPIILINCMGFYFYSYNTLRKV